MTEQEAIKRFLAGDAIRIVEYRSTHAERIEWTDKDTGKAMTAPICRHTVEGGIESIAVGERLPNEADVTKVVSPFKKGDKCVFLYTSVRRDRGNVSGQGTLEPLAGGSRA